MIQKNYKYGIKSEIFKSIKESSTVQLCISLNWVDQKISTVLISAHFHNPLTWGVYMNTLQNSFSVKVQIHKMPRLKLYTSTDSQEYCSRVHHSKQEYVKISKKKTGTRTYKVLPLRGGTRNQRPQSFLHRVSTHWSWLQSRQINSQLLFIYKH